MAAIAPSTTLTALVTKFKYWLAAHYSQQEIEQLRSDDAGYPGWPEIDNYFALIACLSVVEQYSQDRDLLQHYLALAAALPGDYLAECAAAMREELF